MNIILTGCAGFIGMHTTRALLELGHKVIGIDNINDYYDQQLKYDRLDQLKSYSSFEFHKIDITYYDELKEIFSKHSPDVVVHLAAQVGVRYSLECPKAYIDSNLVGFSNILECSRAHPPQHLIYASSSSVYGEGLEMPLHTDQRTDSPISLYAATKKANELMAHTYHHLYQLSCTGLRFFTVYGPWGRPDMSPFIFVKNILAEKTIDVFNQGDMLRDFTYVDDIVGGILAAVSKSEKYSQNPINQVFNIGSSSPVKLLTFIEVIEKALGKKANKNLMPKQPGDVHSTYACMKDFEKEFQYKPSITLEDGMKKFVSWYLDHYVHTQNMKKSA